MDYVPRMTAWRRRGLAMYPPAYVRPKSRCATRTGVYDDLGPTAMTHDDQHVPFVAIHDDLHATPFGFRSDRPLSVDTVRFAMDRAKREGVFGNLVAFRCPFNIFERVSYNALDLLAESGIRFVADRALLPRSRVPSEKPTFIKIGSSFTPHDYVDLPSIIKAGLKEVIQIERHITKTGEMPGDVEEALQLGRRLAVEIDHLVNMYAWETALRERIRPTLKRIAGHFREFGNKRSLAWADKYATAFEVLIGRIGMAAELTAFRQNVQIYELLNNVCPTVAHIWCVERKALTILRAAGADVLFSPGILMNMEDDDRKVTKDDARIALKMIAKAPLMEFEQIAAASPAPPKAKRRRPRSTTGS